MIDPVKKAIFGYSELGKKEDSLGVKAIDHYALLLEAAASRKELLRDVEHEFENLGKCLICHSSDKMDDKLWHADDCELAKELDND